MNSILLCTRRREEDDHDVQAEQTSGYLSLFCEVPGPAPGPVVDFFINMSLWKVVKAEIFAKKVGSITPRISNSPVCGPRLRGLFCASLARPCRIREPKCCSFFLKCKKTHGNLIKKLEEEKRPTQMKLNILGLEDIGFSMLGKLARAVYHVFNKIVGYLQQKLKISKWPRQTCLLQI